jgi:hypothetical protein
LLVRQAATASLRDLSLGIVVLLLKPDALEKEAEAHSGGAGR